MNEYNIFGAIVDNDSDKWSSEDITLSDFCSYTNGLKDGDEVSFVFNSPGGSVTAGVAMANKIRALKDRGIKTTARVEGVCASIATVMMCACDEIVVSKGSFVMIHNCWAVVQGDANTLRKEADLMEKMNEAILSFYRSKFNATDEQLKQWMDDETWISSEDVDEFGLICKVDDNEVEFKIAASINRYDFKHIPEVLNMEKKIEEEIEKSQEEIEKVEDEVLSETPDQDVVVPQDETTNEEEEKEEEKEEEETSTEEPKEDEEVKPTYEELLARIAELEKELDECQKQKDEEKDTITKDECEKRVSGMQSKMQAKINDFTSQLKVKDEELNKVRAELTSLNQKLEEANGELSKMASALEEKNNALAQLNAGVLRPSKELPTMEDGLAQCAGAKERVEFLKSGKYIR